MPLPVRAACTLAVQPTFAYVLNYTDATISMYTVDSCTGSLTATTPASIPVGIHTGINSESMALDPSGKFLYIANLVSNAMDSATVSMFSINSTTGILTPTTPAMVSTGFFPQGIAVDPSGKFAYTANSDDNTVSIFTISSSTGVLTPTTPAALVIPPLFTSRSTESGPDFVNVGPSGQVLYVTDQDNGSISTFAIDSNTGTLTSTNPAGTIAGPDPGRVTVDPSGKFAYVPDEDLSAVFMYTVDPNSGSLTANPLTFVPAGNQASSLVIDPSSKFLYVVNRFDNTVSMFAIDQNTGTLTPAVQATIPTGKQPYPIVMDASGTFVYVGNQGDNSVGIYKIQANGILEFGGTVPTGNDPVSIVLTH